MKLHPPISTTSSVDIQSALSTTSVRNAIELIASAGSSFFGTSSTRTRPNQMPVTPSLPPVVDLESSLESEAVNNNTKTDTTPVSKISLLFYLLTSLFGQNSLVLFSFSGSIVRLVALH